MSTQVKAEVRSTQVKAEVRKSSPGYSYGEQFWLWTSLPNFPITTLINNIGLYQWNLTHIWGRIYNRIAVGIIAQMSIHEFLS
jgi:hypothetical protein